MNDNLCQIEKCWRYAETSGRTLVIDTMNSGGFGLPFRTFFEKRDKNEPILLSASPVLLEELDALATFPPWVGRKLRTYKLEYDRELRQWVECETRRAVTFDFNLSYPEPLLVHEQSGGGRHSFKCLTRLVLAEEFRRDVFSRLRALEGLDYAAIVVRNTDYQTDYVSGFRSLHEKVRGKNLLVCSDDPGVITYAKSNLTGVNVIALPGSQDTNGVPVAKASLMSDPGERYRFAVNAMSDLIGLACADPLFLTRLNHGRVEYSGFVMLSGMLNRNISVVHKLAGLESSGLQGHLRQSRSS